MTSKFSTVLSGAKKADHNGKFFVELDNNRLNPDGSFCYVMSTVSSPPWFDTEEEALQAGSRVLKVLEETGRYPNMCVPF